MNTNKSKNTQDKVMQTHWKLSDGSFEMESVELREIVDAYGRPTNLVVLEIDRSKSSPSMVERFDLTIASMLRAVNSHEALLKAVKDAMGAIPAETRLFEQLNLAVKQAEGNL